MIRRLADAITTRVLNRTVARNDAILSALRGGEMSSYALTRAVGRKPGTLHPDLAALERAGFVTSRWGVAREPGGPRPRLYRLTGGAS